MVIEHKRNHWAESCRSHSTSGTPSQYSVGKIQSILILISFFVTELTHLSEAIGLILLGEQSFPQWLQPDPTLSYSCKSSFFLTMNHGTSATCWPFKHGIHSLFVHVLSTYCSEENMAPHCGRDT